MAKPKEHIAFSVEPDGSLCLLLVPRDYRLRDKDEAVLTLGHIRRDPSGFLSTRDFPEFPDYEGWERHPTAEAAIASLVLDADSSTYADIASGLDRGMSEDPDDEAHRALDALGLIKFPDDGLSRKTAGMLARGRAPARGVRRDGHALGRILRGGHVRRQPGRPQRGAYLLGQERRA